MEPRKVIKTLKTYEVRQDDYIVKLDANESMSYFTIKETLDLSNISRYPDYDSTHLRIALSKDLLVDEKHITVGNGSSELLDLLFKSYLESNDLVASFHPSFSMYEVYANLYGATYLKVDVEEDFRQDINKMLAQLEMNPKIIVLCTPNNPTGFQMKRRDIIKLLEATEALVIVDEAYMEFSSSPETLMHDITTYPNLVVLRTFSKAYGLAGARLGYMIAGDVQTNIIKTVRSPYHVNALTQSLGIQALLKKTSIFNEIQRTIEVRQVFMQDLVALGFTVYPSEGNFLWIKTDRVDLASCLKAKGVLIRNYASYQPGFFRITITNQKEMQVCLGALKEVLYEKER